MYTHKGPKQMLQSAGDDKTLETFGGRVRAIRKARGHGVTSVAKQIGLSRTSFNQWEADQVKNPDVKKLGAFVQLVDCSLDWLIERKGPDPDLTLPKARRRRGSAAPMPIVSPGDAVGPVMEPPIPEIAAALTLHAKEIDFSPRALWTIPHQVLEIGFNTVPQSAVIKRVITRDGDEFGMSRGDYCLIDTSRRRIDEAGVYVVADPEGICARRVLIVDKQGRLEIAAFADDTSASTPHTSVDKLEPLGRVMGILKPA